LALLWKVEISDSSVRHITMRHGQVAAALIDQQVAQLEAMPTAAEAKPEQLVMCTDGAMVQLTSGEWREVKMVTFGEFASVWDAKHREVVTKTERLSYFARAQTADDFGRSALVEWHRRGGENARRVVAVNDGALWIQSFIDYHCPRAIRVLDFAHAQEYVATVGRAIYGADTEAFRGWYGRMSRQLGQQSPQRTVADLRFLLRQHPDHPETEVMEQAIRYLDRRRAMIDYPHFRRQQLPIGSGHVESGHKVVMQKRMKQAGMRWAEASLNPMLALRTTLCNQTWQTSWQAVTTQIRQTRYDRQPQAGPAANETAPNDLVTEADCQRLTALADRIAKRTKKRTPWTNHDWIFLYRRQSLHKKQSHPARRDCSINGETRRKGARDLVAYRVLGG
jgi:hypothetical protein